MTRGEQRLSITGPSGALQLALNLPERAPRGIALQGETMDNKVMQTLAKTFAGLGYASVRFNFRGVAGSAGVFDDGAGETDDALAALAHARTTYGDLPVVLAGFSFGTFIQTRVAQQVTAERMVLIAPAVARFGTGAVPTDTIVIHGEEDDVVGLADVFAWARPQQLAIVVFPGCGHFFHGRLPQLTRVIAGMWR